MRFNIKSEINILLFLCDIKGMQNIITIRPFSLVHNADIIGFKCLECISLDDLENVIEVLGHRFGLCAQISHISSRQLLVRIGLRQVKVLCLESELHLV